MKSALVPYYEFVGLGEVTHLYTAAEGPLPTRSAAALPKYANQKGAAEAGRSHHANVAQECRASVAKLLGVDSEAIAFMASASDAINAVCGLIDFQPGDNVVLNDLEFPSVALPWLRLKSQGVEVRVVQHQNWNITSEDLLGAVDDRTRLVALSHVSFVNGLRHDVERIGSALQGTQTLFLLDATQSLGVLPVEASIADFVVSSTYKWLLGTHGLGILYWNRSRMSDVEPLSIGWYSVADTLSADRYQSYTLRADAGRFESGYINFPAIYVLNESLDLLLQVGVDRLTDHSLDLGDLLVNGLSQLGLEVMSPADRNRRGASVTFAHPDAATIGSALAERDVHVWAGDGRVRASAHLFNDEGDIECYLSVLEEVLRA